MGLFELVADELEGFKAISSASRNVDLEFGECDKETKDPVQNYASCYDTS